MKIGLSIYSLSKAIKAGEMDIIQAIQWIADNGGTHVEITPRSYPDSGDEKLIEAVVRKAKETGLEISSYTFGANFIVDDNEKYENEIKRVKKEIDIANLYGARLVRHDTAYRPMEEATLDNFEKDLPVITEACREIADYAKKYGITTSVENHGYHIQESERVLRLIKAVGMENFKTTLDIGNFLCVDENPVSAVKNNLPYASMIHLKDFYIRPEKSTPGEGWFKSRSGKHLRAAIFGHGDIDTETVMDVIRNSSYQGYISIEFEGLEDCRDGSRIGMANAMKMLKI